MTDALLTQLFGQANLESGKSYVLVIKKNMDGTLTSSLARLVAGRVFGANAAGNPATFKVPELPGP